MLCGGIKPAGVGGKIGIHHGLIGADCIAMAVGVIGHALFMDGPCRDQNVSACVVVSHFLSPFPYCQPCLMHYRLRMMTTFSASIAFTMASSMVDFCFLSTLAAALGDSANSSLAALFGMLSPSLSSDLYFSSGSSRPSSMPEESFFSSSSSGLRVL